VLRNTRANHRTRTARRKTVRSARDATGESFRAKSAARNYDDGVVPRLACGTRRRRFTRAPPTRRIKKTLRSRVRPLVKPRGERSIIRALRDVTRAVRAVVQLVSRNSSIVSVPYDITADVKTRRDFIYVWSVARVTVSRGQRGERKLNLLHHVQGGADRKTTFVTAVALGGDVAQGRRTSHCVARDGGKFGYSGTFERSASHVRRGNVQQRINRGHTARIPHAVRSCSACNCSPDRRSILSVG